jgi:hypothetical protein
LLLNKAESADQKVEDSRIVDDFGFFISVICVHQLERFGFRLPGKVFLLMTNFVA